MGWLGWSRIDPIAQENGYEQITTFWMDFSIADTFGVDAIQDTFNRAFREWKTDYKYLTELVMTLNHKQIQWFYKTQKCENETQEKIGKQYDELYLKLFNQARNYAESHLKGEELSYYYDVTN